jgi:hypothetical protein
MGVMSHAGEGDGVYPVFRVYENGFVRGLYIDFQWSPPDKDEDGMVTLGNVRNP